MRTLETVLEFSHTDTMDCDSGPNKDTQAELAERVAAIEVDEETETSTVLNSEDMYRLKNNGMSSETSEDVFLSSQDQRDLSYFQRATSRPTLSNRKFSLQERPTGGCLPSQNQAYGPYATGPASHISPRIVRRPTIESNRVSISDSDVSTNFCLTVEVDCYRGNIRSPHFLF